MQDDSDDQDDTTGAMFPSQLNAGPRPPVEPSPEGDTGPAPQAEEGPGAYYGPDNPQRRRALAPDAPPAAQEQGEAYYGGKDTADKAQWPPPGATPPPHYIPNTPNAPKGIQPRQIMNYLAGADANPQLTQQAEQAASQQLEQHSGENWGGEDPNAQGGGPSQSDVHLIALHVAAEHGGPEASYAVQQTYRSKYNAFMGHAHVALSGTDAKPADLNAATHSATQAASYVLDGTDTTFAPGSDGQSVTATVRYPGKPAQQYQLTIPQFNQYTDIGNVQGGQYDALHENTSTLQRLMQEPGSPPTSPGGGQQQGPQGAQAAPQGGAPAPGQPAQTPQAPQQPTPNGTGRNAQGQRDINQDHPFQYAADEGVDPVLARRSHVLFPTVGQEPQRIQYLDKMTQQGVANEQASRKINAPYGVQQLRGEQGLEQTNAKVTGANQVAATRAQAYTDARQVVAASKDQESARRLQGVFAQVAGGHDSAILKGQASILSKQIGSLAANAQDIPPALAQQVADFMKLTVGAGQQAQPQQQDDQSSGAPAQRPPPVSGVPGGPTAQAAPTTDNQGGGKFKPPAGAGWQFNAAKGQYRDLNGKVYDINGKPVQPQQ